MYLERADLRGGEGAEGRRMEDAAAVRVVHLVVQSGQVFQLRLEEQVVVDVAGVTVGLDADVAVEEGRAVVAVDRLPIGGRALRTNTNTKAARWSKKCD